MREALTPSGEDRTRLVVFDLDGTLVDSIGDIAASANEALVATYGDSAGLPLDVVRGFVGGGARQLVERCLLHSGRDAADVPVVFDRFIARYSGRLTETTRLYSGMTEALDSIERGGARLAILTNKPGTMSRAIARDLGVADRFVANIGGDDLKTRKPDPAGLLRIAADAGVPLHQVAMIGDSAIDIRTAKNAGARSVGVLWGYDPKGLAAERPDAIAHAPGELSALLGLA